MVHSIFLYVMALIGVVLTYFIVIGRLDVFKYGFTYLGILSIPVFLIGYPVLFFKILSHAKNYDKIIPVIIIGIEIFVLLIFTFWKANFYSYKSKHIDLKHDKKIQCIVNGNKIIRYAIFTAIVYCIPVLGCIGMSLWSGFMTIVSFCTIITVVLSVPLSIICFYTMTIGIILMAIVVIISVNGAVHLAYSMPEIRKHIIRHIIFMFLPIFNIICMFHLYFLSKKELKIRMV